ncbi:MULTISPECIES: DHA2 family efflux MFS transporter permease subunit [unclassified Mycobacterium]|uniref:DHA2 family efflux MFS transporter permease subunit n=1 Tax=unclassified Mycobacterium TaxID=2642494 RepID=UPI0029C85347|nr:MULTISPECIES: DHA2 family efflux MFS transporter permease subunit [unclassified Mycobacterium]
MRVSDTAKRWLGLVAIALGVALIVVDTTIVNVIVPSIVRDLGVTSVQAQWIQESYAIVFAALLLLVGRVADILGARRVFLAGVILFGATSLLAGLAPTGEMLVLARFLQGAGAALILPTSLALLNASFTGKARGQAFAVWGSTIGAATALGPLLGGWLSEHASWRWAFGINIPLVVVICIAALAFIKRSPRTTGRVDVVGAVLSIVGLGLLAFGLIEGRTYGWIRTIEPFKLFGLTWSSNPSPVLIALILATIALVAFTARQVTLSRSGEPGQPTTALMDVRLFSIGSFRNGNIATLIIGLGEFGIVAVLPLWLQFALGYSPVEAGLALVPVAVGSFVASGASFGLAAKMSPLGLVRLGLALEVVGLAVLGFVARPDSPWWEIALALFFYGIGVGFATAQVTNVVLVDVPEPSAGQGSGVQSVFRQLGSALGIAVLTTTFFSVLGSRLSGELAASGVPAGQADQLTRAVVGSAGAAIDGLAAQPQTAAVADAARAAMAHGISLGSYLAAAFLLAGLVATLLITASRPETEALPEGVEQQAVGRHRRD